MDLINQSGTKLAVFHFEKSSKTPKRIRKKVPLKTYLSIWDFLKLVVVIISLVLFLKAHFLPISFVTGVTLK